ncbi:MULTISPECIES: hypothetical protein [Romboutsia]|uniref:hypothetical protein n=1 Tax=Romboutsia TaxID=1501226 RepID=UPI0018A99504|nr:MULTISPECIES: hypothetical protein [Romboutsia]MCH1960671.1 hypothetical protein [Romboutsia hominis]MCH1968897.1 hypothetical protein [Romboutsia hominis]MDB8793583.1 hypothetical protein [Romboutsia sp. 1001216sp1]MDB8794980.1 hypothetical protein [Romboutsia sp. 1001216sp1]MDB8798791.1 hypothetical protein [Romboutsia sp. 1001216sp1]
MERVLELIERKFLKDSELLELEDSEFVINLKYKQPYNAHYNEYLITININETIKEYSIYLKHR